MTDRRRAPGRQNRPDDRTEEDNPFAPPPEGRPDQPWQPRFPPGSDSGSDSGSDDPDDSGDGQRQRWGSQWSRRQPRRANGGFGDPESGEERRPGGPGGGRGRWDPSDPVQRHARYAVLAGMWGVFSGLLGWEWLGLLLGALALYWGISALRGGPKEPPEARQGRVDALEGRAAPPTGPPVP
ncbi:hypothetical protein RM780_21995, partial [Streptomyces sp. DSM 44917]|nr:hypothetical protein [Streptomyces sp. DSM 44917]